MYKSICDVLPNSYMHLLSAYSTYSPNNFYLFFIRHTCICIRYVVRIVVSIIFRREGSRGFKRHNASLVRTNPPSFVLDSLPRSQPSRPSPCTFHPAYSSHFLFRRQRGALACELPAVRVINSIHFPSSHR